MKSQSHFGLQQKLADATDDDQVIYRTVRRLFDVARERMAPVRLLGVAVADLAASDALDPTDAGALFTAPPTDQARLLQAMDKIRDRFGEGAIRHGGGETIDRRTHG